MGITQSDEYCDVYDNFMEEYDEGKPVADITKDILNEYLEEFEPDDGILHDVYFALGKAQWMCGGISDEILSRISQIIKNDENIAFYRELEASEKDLKLRKKNLEKFLCGLSTPREKARKRKTPTEKYVPEPPKPHLPKIECGDIFAYENNGKYRLFTLVEIKQFYGSKIAYCYAWRKSFDKIPAANELFKEYVLPLGWFKGETFPPTEKLTFVENLPLLETISHTFPNVICKDWEPAVNALAQEVHLTEEYPLSLCMTLEDVLEKIKYI